MTSVLKVRKNSSGWQRPDKGFSLSKCDHYVMSHHDTIRSALYEKTKTKQSKQTTTASQPTNPPTQPKNWPCCILMQLDLESKRSGKSRRLQLSWFIQTEMERSGMLQSELVLWDLSIRGGRGGGFWQWTFSLLACDVYGVWCDSERSLFCLLIDTGSDLI